jgi:hypothetical protein
MQWPVAWRAQPLSAQPQQVAAPSRRGMAQPPVSRRTAASVDRHCGANTTRPAATARWPGSSCWRSAAPAPGRVVAGGRQRIHRAQRTHRHLARRQPGTSAMLICQLKPMGSNTSASAWPSCRPGCIRWPPGGARRRRREAGQRHSATVSTRMMPPTRRRKICTRCHRPMAMLRRRGPVVGRQLHHQRAHLAARGETLEHPGHRQRAQDAGQVQREQHQPLQLEATPRRWRAGTKAPISSAYTGSRAEQVISGAIMMVTSRSRGLAMVRAAMMPGWRRQSSTAAG